jgi:hypothetical protein
VVAPEVLNFARTFYNCPTLEGVPLENQGGSGSAGSHWEKAFLPKEFLNPTVENPAMISMFTINYLVATNYYRVTKIVSFKKNKNSNFFI